MKYLQPCPLLASLMAQQVKNLLPMQETMVQSLGQEDSLEEEMATHSSILAWSTPWTEKPGWFAKSQTQLSNFVAAAATLSSGNEDLPHCYINQGCPEMVCIYKRILTALARSTQATREKGKLGNCKRYTKKSQYGL